MYDTIFSTSFLSIVSTIFVTTITTGGKMKIISINLVSLGIVFSTIIMYVTSRLKLKFPNWDKKAWFPVVLGILLFICAGLISKDIVSIQSLIKYIISGIATGSIASSIRDIYKGK